MTSCNEISNQLAALSADIAALDDKFALKSEVVTKTEFNEFKAYVNRGFQAITDTLYKLYQRLENEKAGTREVGFLDNRVDELQRQIDRWQGEDRQDLTGYATKQELFQLGISLRTDISSIARLSNAAYEMAVTARNEILPFKRRIEIVELDVKNIKAVADIAVRQSSDALNETRLLKAKVTVLESRITALDTLIKVLQGSVLFLTKTVAGLAIAITAMQAQIAYLYSQIGKDRYDELLARIDENFRIAINARMKANSAYDLAKKVDDKILGIERKITQLDEKINRVAIQLQQEIRTLGDILRKEIQYLTERAFAAMQRLEAKIDYATQFILDSVRIAINSVYSRISALETVLQQRINSIDSRLTNKIGIIERAIVNLYGLTFDALDRIDELDRLQIPRLKMALTALEARINALPKGINRIETRTLQLQPQYFINNIIQPTTIKEVIIRQLQPINNTFFTTNTIERIIQVAVPQQIINNKYESINQSITKNTIEMVKFIKVSVPIGTCELIDGIWQFVESVIDVDVIVGDGGSDALSTFNSFMEKFKGNKMLCEAKNNSEECECYAAVPDAWLLRPEHKRPQMIFQFGEIQGNKLGSPKYEICIPHPKAGYKPSPNNCPLPSYKKGNWEIIYVLNDNSKITIHSLNELEGQKMLKACIALVNPRMLTEAYLSKNGIVRTKEPLAQILVKPRMAKLFPEGRKNVKPDWVVHFEQ